MECETLDPAAAVAALDLTVESVFVPFSQSRNKDEKHRSLNWQVTLKRRGHAVLSTDYSAGIAHCPSYRQRRLSVDEDAALQWECENGKTAQRVPTGASSFYGRKPILPDALDVIYSLVMDSDVLDAGGFEKWAGDLGYDTDSRAAESIYRACLDIALKLRAGIGEEGLHALREAFQDY